MSLDDELNLKKIWEWMPMGLKICVVVALLLFSIFVGCEIVKNLKDSYHPDCIAEEILEEVIESQTGLDIDLSPSTPEK